MKITLNEDGICLPDVEIEEYIRFNIDKVKDIHVSNILSIHWCRAILFQIPPKERPKVEWAIYGKNVLFDDDLRCWDDLNDKRTEIEMEPFSILLGNNY